jgi:hypothetical protein
MAFNSDNGTAAARVSQSTRRGFLFEGFQRLGRAQEFKHFVAPQQLNE